MTFREVSLAGLTPPKGLSAVALADQPRPMLQWIDLAQLVIDDRYQRQLGARNLAAIQKIADEFDWMQFSPVLVAPADAGRFAVIDGQHRVHAAALCGIAQVPAQIVLASPADQARAFAGVNAKVTPITVHQVYRAALVAREPWAERCCAVVEAAGCRLATANPSAKDRKPGVIYQVGTIRKMICERGMADAVGAALRGMVAYDTKGRVALYSDYILTPLINAIHSDPMLVVGDVAGFLRAHDPFRLLNAAEKERLNGSKISNMTALRLAMQHWMVRQ